MNKKLKQATYKANYLSYDGNIRYIEISILDILDDKNKRQLEY